MSDKSGLRVPDYMDHVIEAIARIESYIKDYSQIEFIANVKNDLPALKQQIFVLRNTQIQDRDE